MAVTKRKLVSEITELLEKKPVIRQQGRVIAHVINELKRGTDSSIREPVREAIESLEQQGVIAVERRGKLIDEIRLVNSSPESKPKTALVAQKAAPKATQARAPRRSTAAVAPKTPQRNAEESSEAPEASTEQKAMELFERLTTKLEEKNAQLSKSAEELSKAEALALELEQKKAESDRQLDIAHSRNVELSQQLEASELKNSELAEQLKASEREKVEAQQNVTKLEQVLREGNDVFELLTEEVKELKAKNAELEAEMEESKSKPGLTDLVSRMSEVLEK